MYRLLTRRSIRRNVLSATRWFGNKVQITVLKITTTVLSQDHHKELGEYVTKCYNAKARAAINRIMLIVLPTHAILRIETLLVKTD